MPKIYKCPICGSEEYFVVPAVNCSSNRDNKIEENSLLEYSFSIGELYSYTFKLNAEVCLCKKCGHVDLFSEELLEKLSAEEERKLKEKQKAEQEEEIIKNLKGPYLDEIKDLNYRYSVLEEKSKDESITVKEYREIQLEIKSIQNRIKVVKKILMMN